MLRHPANEGQAGSQSAVLFDKRLLPKRFVVVSNRLPYQLDMTDGEVRFKRGIGGLVTALDPILSLTGGTWVGWTGSYDRLPPRVEVQADGTGQRPYDLVPVRLDPRQVEQYYLGYSNRCLWPLFHYFQEHCEFNRDHWEVYCEVNREFADAIVDCHEDGDMIWVHDYHLMLLP
ncbi:MAG TPA: trehalose-6-phosphate synthase, partial [Candidatus Polarisedimenticolaceae bacterium]|nr:trehalose-6-phosphate synthase [Candidatus Polarisedimenticolaceae bacterium]